MSTEKQKPRTTQSMFIAVLSGVIAGIKANAGAAKAVTLGGVATTWTAVIAILQASIDAFTAASNAKVAASKAVVTAKAAEATAKAQLTLIKAWAIGQFGNAAYAMFGFTPPKVPSTSAVKKAIGVSKRAAARVAKKAALAGIAPTDEEATTSAAIAQAISAPASEPTPAPVAATPAVTPHP